MKIYFIRHAEGIHNKEIDGHNIKFPSLTDFGQSQALSTKNQLKNIMFNKIISSPLKRTLQTAYIIFEKKTVTALELIREYNGSICDNRENKNHLKNMFKEYDFSLIYDNYDYNKSEDDIMFKNRIDQFYKWLTTNNNYDTIAIISHGSFLFEFFKIYGDILKIKNNAFLNNCEYRIGYI